MRVSQHPSPLSYFTYLDTHSRCVLIDKRRIRAGPLGIPWHGGWHPPDSTSTTDPIVLVFYQTSSLSQEMFEDIDTMLASSFIPRGNHLLLTQTVPVQASCPAGMFWLSEGKNDR